MPGFESLYQRALLRFHSADALQEQLPLVLSAAELRQRSDDRYLSLMCLRVFRAGLRHSMVDSRWPEFEQVFFGFNVAVLAAMSDEALESAMAREGIIRHWGKVQAIRHNAAFVQQVAAEQGSFAEWIAGWPSGNIVGLWRELKQRGRQLGGMSGPTFLRMAGKDTFLLTTDVVSTLQKIGLVERKPTAQRDLNRVQDAFNHWQQESGRPLCEISRVVASAY